MEKIKASDIAGRKVCSLAPGEGLIVKKDMPEHALLKFFDKDFNLVDFFTLGRKKLYQGRDTGEGWHEESAYAAGGADDVWLVWNTTSQNLYYFGDVSYVKEYQPKVTKTKIHREPDDSPEYYVEISVVKDIIQGSFVEVWHVEPWNDYPLGKIKTNDPEKVAEKITAFLKTKEDELGLNIQELLEKFAKEVK